MTYGQAIRNHAKEYGHEVAGKLTRHPELEQYKKERVYADREIDSWFIAYGVFHITLKEESK